MAAITGDSNVIVGNMAQATLPKALKTTVVMIAAKHHGLLAQMFGLLGKSEYLPVEKRQDGYLAVKSSRMRYTDGDKFFMQVAGSYPEPSILMDGQPEVELVQATYDPNLFGRHEQQMTHYYDDIVIPGSEIDKVKGEAKAAESLVDAYFKVHSEGIARRLKRDLWADTSQSQAALAGIQRIVNQTTPSQYLLDSSVPEWTAQAIDQAGALNTLDNVNLLQTQIMEAGGVMDVMCGDTNTYSWIRKRMESVGNLAQWHDTLKFGGSTIQYDTAKLCLDSDAPAGKLYGFCSERWYMFTMDSPDIKSWTEKAPYFKDAGHGKISFRIGVGCEKRNENGVLYGITKPTS